MSNFRMARRNEYRKLVAANAIAEAFFPILSHTSFRTLHFKSCNQVTFAELFLQGKQRRLEKTFENVTSFTALLALTPTGSLTGQNRTASKTNKFAIELYHQKLVPLVKTWNDLELTELLIDKLEEEMLKTGFPFKFFLNAHKLVSHWNLVIKKTLSIYNKIHWFFNCSIAFYRP